MARWRAFKRYLQNLEKYTKVEEAAEIFERYLPYAVAFGLEQSWIRKFAEGGCAAADLVDPLRLCRGRTTAAAGGRRRADIVPGHAAPMPARAAQRPP